MNYLVTYLPTYISKQLTPFIRVLEGATASQLFIKFLAFNQYMFSATSVFIQMNPFHTFNSDFFYIHFNIIFPATFKSC